VIPTTLKSGRYHHACRAAAEVCVFGSSCSKARQFRSSYAAILVEREAQRARRRSEALCNDGRERRIAARRSWLSAVVLV